MRLLWYWWHPCSHTPFSSYPVWTPFPEAYAYYNAITARRDVWDPSVTSPLSLAADIIKICVLLGLPERSSWELMCNISVLQVVGHRRTERHYYDKWMRDFWALQGVGIYSILLFAQKVLERKHGVAAAWRHYAGVINGVSRCVCFSRLLRWMFGPSRRRRIYDASPASCFAF